MAIDQQPLDVGAFSLGLEHLPPRIAKLASGMVYSVACDQQAVRLPLLAAALAAAVKVGRPCALVTPSDPGMFLRKAKLAGFPLEAAVRDGTLLILQLAPDAGKRLFRLGVEAFLAEIEVQLPAPGTFIAIDRADPLFLLSDPAGAEGAAQHYVRWTSARGNTVLALFTPAAVSPRDYLTLRAVSEDFAGFAVAKPTEGGAVLEIRHWFGAEGANPRESFGLRLHTGGALTVRPASANAEDDDLPPVETVIFVRGTLGEPATTGRSWQEVDSIADAVDAAGSSHAATLLLPFQRPSDYDLLCRAIVTVRAMRRPALRVVVHEGGMRLRASQALALMRLGASAVLPPDVPDSAVKQMVDSLQGTHFTRPYEMDAQQVDEDTTRLMQRPTDTARAFCDAVESLLAATDGFDIQNCLVRTQLAGTDAAAVSRFARRCGRDLLAFAEGDRVWLFLFGCPVGATPTLLSRFFRNPVAGSQWSTEREPERILACLRELRDGHAQAPARDKPSLLGLGTGSR